MSLVNGQESFYVDSKTIGRVKKQRKISFQKKIADFKGEGSEKYKNFKNAEISRYCFYISISVAHLSRASVVEHMFWRIFMFLSKFSLK